MTYIFVRLENIYRVRTKFNRPTKHNQQNQFSLFPKYIANHLIKLAWRVANSDIYWIPNSLVPLFIHFPACETHNPFPTTKFDWWCHTNRSAIHVNCPDKLKLHKRSTRKFTQPIFANSHVHIRPSKHWFYPGVWHYFFWWKIELSLENEYKLSKWMRSVEHLSGPLNAQLP